MKRKYIYGMILSASMLLFSGCGSDSKSNAGDLPESQIRTSLSIVYVSTEYDANKGMVGHYRVHAVDQNDNPISGLALSMSIINGVKKIGGVAVQYGTGTISTTEPISFSDYRIPFSQIGVEAGDTLMVLPSVSRTEASYLGDWQITNVGTNLTLANRAFNLESTDGLTYIIGNEKRFLGRDIAVAHILDGNSSSVTDEKGFTNFSVVFDPKLAGHTVVLGAHTSGNRKGIAEIVGLRWNNFGGSTVTVPRDGRTHTAYMTLAITNEDGTALEHLYDVDIVPASFSVEPVDKCELSSRSNFHTDAGGRVTLIINTTADTNATADSNTTEASTCTVTWNGSNSSIYLEY